MKSLFTTLKACQIQINWSKAMRIAIAAIIAMGVVAYAAPTQVQAKKGVAWGGCAPSC